MGHDPDWFRNLRKASVAMVQIGSGTFPASVRVLTGEERDTAFRDVVVAQVQRFADYEAKSGRTMPLALLTPLPPDRCGERTLPDCSSMGMPREKLIVSTRWPSEIVLVRHGQSVETSRS